jgi:hypothetical protein
MFWKEVFFSSFYLVLVLWLIRKLRFFSLEALPKSWVYLAFGLKVIASILMVVLYTWYYTDISQNDVYRLYTDSGVLYRLFFEDPFAFFQIFSGIGSTHEHHGIILERMNNWYSQGNFFTGTNRFIIRLHVVYSLLSGGSFFARFILHDFLILSGLLVLYRFLSAESMIRRKEIFAAVFLFPSVVFWSSGIFKEGIILSGMGLLLWGSRKFIKEIEFGKGFWYFLSGSLLLLLTRPYLLLILLFYLPIRLIRRNSCKAPFRKYLILTLFAISIIGITDYLLPGFNPYRILVEKQISFISHAQHENAGSLIYLPALKENPLSLFSSGAVGFYNTLFRPMFFDMKGITGFAASVENFFLLLLIIMSFFYYRRGNPQQNFLYFCLFVALANMLVIGLTVPVAGAIMRYKTSTLPFLLCALSLALSSHTPFHRIFRSSP